MSLNVNTGSGPSPVSEAGGLGRRYEAEQIVMKYVRAAMIVGLVPVPVVDMAALMAIQVRMLSRLSKLYGVEFSDELGKSTIGSLVGAGTSLLASATSSRVLSRLIPLTGWPVIAINTSFFGGASTYALGKVFIQHFDSGGTFLTFDPEKVRQYYAQQLAEGNVEVRKSFVGVRP